MRYLGGKTKIAARLVESMADDVRRLGSWWDPFCGGLSVTRELFAIERNGTASDGNRALISLYRSVADGWTPPPITQRVALVDMARSVG